MPKNMPSYSAQRSERSDAKHNMALTITYLPTYHDKKEKKYPVTNNERYEFIKVVINYLEGRKISCIEQRYEYGNNDKLHLHCVAATNVRIYPYPKYRNCRLEFRKLYNAEGWSSYKNKENSTSHQQNLTQKYFLNPNHFQFNEL